ncbi:MAG: hypothetical protein ACK417_05265 [Bacteroidia bacterium]
MSNASPLGVPFHNLRGSSQQQHQAARLAKGKVGSPCTKKFLKLLPAFGEETLCSASTKYIRKAIKALEGRELSAELLALETAKLHEKECLCSGLTMPFLEEFDLDKSLEGSGVSVCPGPNIAYFEGKFSLLQMVSHIYGRTNLMVHTNRSHMFLKEAQLYLSYLQSACAEFYQSPTTKQGQYLLKFVINMRQGLMYYAHLEAQGQLVSGPTFECRFEEWRDALNDCENRLNEVLSCERQ